MHSRVFSAAGLVATWTLIASCGGGSDVTAPPKTTVAAITLSQSAVSVEAGFSTQIAVVIKNAADSVLTGIPVTWQSDNPAVATIAAGTIDALSVGSTRITATAGGKTASATVDVIPTIVNSIRLSRTSAALAPQRTLQLTADALDRLDRKIPSRTISFTTSNNSIADVNTAGLVSTKAIGVATITASAGDKQAPLSLTVALPTPLSIAIRPTTPEGFLQLSSWSLKVRQPDDSLSVVSSTGSEAVLSGSMVVMNSLQLEAKAPGALTSTLSAVSFAMPTTVPIVFIPENIAITSGNFSGSSVGVSLTAATTPCAVMSDQCFNGFYGNAFSNGVKRWASYPIPVVVSDGLDSSRVWDALRAMEAATGKKLFVLSDGTNPNRIDVRAGLPPGISGFGGYTTWNWDAANRMTSATVWLASPPSRTLVQHEFLHALGFWHTCAWLSVMGGYGCAQAGELSLNDVAYVLLASAIYDAESKIRLPNGQLPCGVMSLWAAVPNKTVNASCFGNNSLLSANIIRQQSAQ
ncbi:MAG TPA: Ig-like domain-containing protein [Gemmatimonadaceae bacterium]|nr:Ig-like domain-containing protein [Gemmatimonadaceae bacterium]